MKRGFYLVIIGVAMVVLSSVGLLLANESAAEILKKVDYNQTPKSVIYDVQMVIHQKDRVDTKRMKMYGVGEEKSYAIFISPERDKGTAVLRLGDNLWMYLPSAEKTVRISGHMLRQGFMGSDFSYSDTTERLKLLERYDASVTGKEQLNGREVYVLELTARQADANYYNRKMWVDSDRYVVLKQEMYAKSGKLLKVMTILDVQHIGDRYYVTKARMEDKLKRNTFTEMIMTNIKLDVEIPDSIFTLQNLERK